MNLTENIQKGYRNRLSKTALEFQKLLLNSKNCKQQLFTRTMCLPACSWAVTKSGTGTWDRDVGLGIGDVGLGDVGHGDVGRGTRGRDKQTTTEFLKYNFRWSRERCNMLESLSLHRRRSSKIRVNRNFGQITKPANIAKARERMTSRLRNVGGD